MRRSVPLSLALLAATLAAARSSAQTGDAPRATASWVIAGRTETAQVSLTWDSVTTDGRPLLGGLIPLDRPWLLGATTPARLTTTTPLRLQSLAIPAGSYNLWVSVAGHSVTLLIAQRSDSNPAEYSPGAVIGSVPMTVDSSAVPVARLTMLIRSERLGPDTSGVATSRDGRRETILFYPGTRTTLVIAWDHFLWSVPITAR